MDHKCNHEGDIAKLAEKVGRMEKALYDNGQKGLITTTILLNENVSNLTSTVTTLTTAVSGLTKFRDETIGGIKAKERMKVHSQWLIGILVTAVLGLVTALIL